MSAEEQRAKAEAAAREAQKIVEDIIADDSFRRRVGIFASALGGFVLFATWLFELYTPLILPPNDPGRVLTILIVSGRGLFIVSGFLLGYTLLRIAERMFVPRHLLKDNSSAEMVRVIIGNESLGRRALKLAGEVLAAARGVGEKK